MARGCCGAIDGTVIPMKKPSREQAGGDSHCYYKGHAASLLLEVVDSDLCFTYINAGAPGNVGDAELYKRRNLRDDIDNGGILRAVELALPEIGGDGIYPYLVVDGAFSPGQHMLKTVNGPPGSTDSIEAELNKRIRACRRVVERVFGILKSSGKFCGGNKHYSNLAFCRLAVEAVCTTSCSKRAWIWTPVCMRRMTV